MSPIEQQPSQAPKPPAARGAWRWLLLGVGGLLTGLAALGALLPVLPTTPFLLLAGACFARSSPSFHARLRRAPLFGTYVAQWDRDRSIPADAKRKAYALIALCFGVSIWAVDPWQFRALLLGVGLALVAFLTRLPTTSEEAMAPSEV